MSSGIRYLSASALEELAPTADEACAAIGHFYGLKARGQVCNQPKLTLTLGPDHLFQSLCCAATDPSFAICKWIGVSGKNAAAGLPNVNGLAILSDAETGLPCALIDAAGLTAIRTAATSLYAARSLARADARSIAFVGTGVQAQSHLTLFAEAFSELRGVRILAGHRGCEALARKAEALGLQPVLLEQAQAVLDEADIVISSVPARGGGPFLDAGWLKPGCFVAAVDLARSWHSASLSSFDMLATDDHDNSAEQQAQKIMPQIGKFRVDLSDIAGERYPDAATAGLRTAFIFSGFALSDLALSVFFFDLDRKRNAGKPLSPILFPER